MADRPRMHRADRPDEAPSLAVAATRSAWWHLVSRLVWATALLALVTSTLSCRGEGSDASPRPPGGSIKTLTAADTILVTDLVGSVLAETDGTGVVKGRFATYPFGATRFDSSSESQKYAGSPRDGAVGLDHMGARFYAAELGVWTSPDPLATTDPERLVTSDFAAANPYAYAKQSPVIAADRDGHFWHIAIGAAVGALVGGGVEAGRQYFTEGKVSDWGRVGAAAAGGGVAGAITAAVPTAGLASTLGTNAGGNVIGGVTERIIASGGQSVGTLGDVAMDAAGSVVGDGVAKGVGAAVRKVGAGAKGAVDRVARPAGGEQVTEGVVRDAMRGAPLRSQQAGGVSLPRVQEYVDRLLAGEGAPAIKVDGQMVVDGNHRYIAGRVLGQEPAIQSWAGGRPDDAVSWEALPIDVEAW